MSVIKVDYGEISGGGSDIGKAEFAFYSCSSNNTLVKVGAYNFATNTAKLNKGSYSSVVSVTGDNIKIEFGKNAEYSVTVTALNDYYLYRFSSRDATFDNIGIELVGKNGTCYDSMYNKGAYFVTEKPITLPTEVWV